MEIKIFNIIKRFQFKTRSTCAIDSKIFDIGIKIKTAFATKY